MKYEDDNILTGWAFCFEKLAALKENTDYDEQYNRNVKLHVEILKQISYLEEKSPRAVSDQSTLGVSLKLERA